MLMLIIFPIHYRDQTVFYKASGGQGIPTVNLGGNLWQADYSNLISGSATARRFLQLE